MLKCTRVNGELCTSMIHEMVFNFDFSNNYDEWYGRVIMCNLSYVCTAHGVYSVICYSKTFNEPNVSKNTPSKHHCARNKNRIEATRKKHDRIFFFFLAV